MKEISLFKKIGYIFDKKQKVQLGILGVMIFIGGLLETLGVGAMIPVVTALLTPETLQEYVDKYPILQKICDVLGVQSIGQMTTALLLALMGIYIVKNLYLLYVVYRQNTFITQSRNQMISRVMGEFLNRPYEQYLGADIPTVFRITDSDIPQTFSLMLAMLQLASEVVVTCLIFLVLLWTDVFMTLFIMALFGVMTLVIVKVFKPRLNKIGAKNQSIQSRIAKWRIQAIYGLKDVKVLNREEFFVRNYYETGKVGANVGRTYAVMNNILGSSGLSSRLFVNLRDKQGLAYTVRSQYDTMLHSAIFNMYIGTAPNNIQKSLDGFKDELQKLADNLVTDDELKGAKENISGRLKYFTQNNSQIGAVNGYNYMMGLGLQYNELFLDDVNNVTAQDVSDMAKRLLLMPKLVTILAPDEYKF